MTRAAYLSEPRKLRVGALVMVDKVYDVIVLALLSVAGAALLVSPLLALALGAFGVAGVYLALRPRDLRTFYALIGKRLPLYARIDTVLAGFAEFRAGVGALCLLYTLGSFLVVLLQYWIIWRAWTAAGTGRGDLLFPAGGVDQCGATYRGRAWYPRGGGLSCCSSITISPAAVAVTSAFSDVLYEYGVAWSVGAPWRRSCGRSRRWRRRKLMGRFARRGTPGILRVRCSWRAGEGTRKGCPYTSMPLMPGQGTYRRDPGDDGARR